MKEFPSRRAGLFYYEPINNENPSPYGLPHFVCDAVGRLGVNGCVGHLKLENQYLVTYQTSYRLMSCWQRVEEGVKKVVRLNTQVAN
jgi:hypothetical protein